MPPDPGPPPRARSWRFLLPLALLAAMGAAAAGLWRFSSGIASAVQAQTDTTAKLVRDINTLETQAARLETRQSDLAAVSQRNSGEIADFARRIEEHDEIVGKINEQMAGGRARFQLAAIEQLLLLANDRVLLARDVRSAITALEAADQRLAALADPRLFRLREAVSQERAALLAVPQVDLAAAALTLASLLDRVARLPLAARVPEHFQGLDDAEGDAPEGADWWERLKASVTSALRGTFAVRRVSAQAPRLLPPEQEALVYQILSLKLEAARLALLKGDAISFRDLCQSASAWLRLHFRADDPGVLAARAELERLQPLDLAPPLPDISRSLGLLRVQLEPEPQ